MSWKMDETDYRERENWTTPVKAIRRKCLDCCAGSRKLVRECHIPACAYTQASTPARSGPSGWARGRRP